MAKTIINAELVRNVLKRVDAICSQAEVPRGWSKTIANEFGLSRQQVQGFKHRFGSADRVPNELGPGAQASSLQGAGKDGRAPREGILLKRPATTSVSTLRRKVISLVKPAPEPEALPNPNPQPEEPPWEMTSLKAQIRELKGVIADQAIEIHRLCEERA